MAWDAKETPILAVGGVSVDGEVRFFTVASLLAPGRPRDTLAARNGLFHPGCFIHKFRGRLETMGLALGRVINSELARLARREGLTEVFCRINASVVATLSRRRPGVERCMS